MQVPFIAAVQVFTAQYFTAKYSPSPDSPELQEVHAAHVVSADPEQPPVFYSLEEHVEQSIH